jgi:hypothetical protein
VVVDVILVANPATYLAAAAAGRLLAFLLFSYKSVVE